MTATTNAADPADVMARMEQLGEPLPLVWYADDEITALEGERIFSRSWQYVGHVGQLGDPGCFITTKVGVVPLVVARHKDGELYAFHNVCRHRAAEVVLEPCGKSRMLVCHYHAWSYNMDGTLQAAPRADREQEFDKSELSLPRVRVETWGPFVFVNLDLDAPSLSDALGEVPQLVADAGIDVDSLVFNQRMDYHMDCNWKVSIENYLECYHCPGAHPGFSHVLDTNFDAYDLQATEAFAWQRGPLRPLAPGAVVAAEGYTGRDGEVEAGIYIVVWPSLTININPGLQNMSIGPMLPAGSGRTHAYLDYFFGENVTEEWIAGMLEFDNEVAAEDQVLIESVQRGIESGSVERARLLQASERLVVAFQHHVARRISTS